MVEIDIKSDITFLRTKTDIEHDWVRLMTFINRLKSAILVRAIKKAEVKTPAFLVLDMLIFLSGFF